MGNFKSASRVPLYILYTGSSCSDDCIFLREGECKLFDKKLTELYGKFSMTYTRCDECQIASDNYENFGKSK